MPARYIDVPLAKVRKMWEAGYNTRQIADVVGCSHGTISKRLVQMGLHKTKRRSSFFKVDLPKAKHMYLELKLPLSQIGDSLRCCPETVRDVLKESGVKMRTPAEGRWLFYKRNKMYSSK